MRRKTKERINRLVQDRDHFQRAANTAREERDEAKRDLALTAQARDQNGDQLVQARAALKAAHDAVGPDGDTDLLEGIRALHRQRQQALDTVKAWLDSHGHHRWEEREREHEAQVAQLLRSAADDERERDDLRAELAALRQSRATARVQPGFDGDDGLLRTANANLAAHVADIREALGCGEHEDMVQRATALRSTLADMGRRAHEASRMPFYADTVRVPSFADPNHCETGGEAPAGGTAGEAVDENGLTAKDWQAALAGMAEDEGGAEAPTGRLSEEVVFSDGTTGCFQGAEPHPASDRGQYIGLRDRGEEAS